MAEVTDLLLEYMALRDLISLLFLLSRILPYYPYLYRPYKSIQGKELGSTSQVHRRSRVSLCRSLSVTL